MRRGEKGTHLGGDRDPCRMVGMKHIRLTDPSLDAELRSTRYDGGSMPSLWFYCPVCGDHYHVVHYRPEGGTDPKLGHVWTHVSGSTLEDLTLSPSYLATCPRGEQTCRLHIFVKNGVMQVLGDSKLE